MLYEDYYIGGFNQGALNGILFNKARFCKLILPDLLKILDKVEKNEIDVAPEAPVKQRPLGSYSFLVQRIPDKDSSDDSLDETSYLTFE